MPPLISVVIPTYNRADILPDTLDSVWSQTYRPLEVLVVDDGSTDETQQVLKTWKSRREAADFLVCLLSQANQGANAARNRGIREVRGECIAFLDSDDLWLPDKLRRQMALFEERPEVGAVYCGLRHRDLETGQVVEASGLGYPSGSLLPQLLIQDVTAPTPCFVLRRACFDRAGLFDESLPARQDWDMWIRVAEHYPFGCVPEVLVEQREHSGERVRSNPQNELRASKAIFQKYRYLRRQYPFWVSLAARSAMYRRRGRVLCHRRESWLRGVGWELAAICVWPFAFDSYAALAGMFLPGGFRGRLHRGWNRVFGRTGLAIRSH